MKQMMYALLLAGASFQTAPARAAFGAGIGLASNNRIVQYADASRPQTFEGPFPVAGVQPGQMLVAMDVQPATGVVYVLGYNPSSGSAQLYTLNARDLSVTAVNQNPIRLRLGATGSAAFAFDPGGNPSEATLRVWGPGGSLYRLDALTGSVNEVYDVQARSVALDNPYSGATFLADGTVRANGFVNADGSDAPPLLSAATPGVQLSARLAPDAGGANVLLYPNPAVNSVRLILNNAPRGAVSLEVIDLNGRLMNSRLYSTGTPEFDLDVSTLPVGVYTVRVLENGVLTHEKQLVRRSE